MNEILKTEFRSKNDIHISPEEIFKDLSKILKIVTLYSHLLLEDLPDPVGLVPEPGQAVLQFQAALLPHHLLPRHLHLLLGPLLPPGLPPTAPAGEGGRGLLQRGERHSAVTERRVPRSWGEKYLVKIILVFVLI